MALLQREETLVSRLEELADRQRRLVTEEDMESLLGLLGDRQRLSTELAGVTHELAPVRRDWSETRLSLGPRQREEADRLMEGAGKRLRCLMDKDEEDARKLSIRKEAVSQTLRAAGAAQGALSAYRAGFERAPRLDFTDAAQ